MSSLAAASPVSTMPVVIIAGYLALLVGLGLFSSRFSKGTSADFFVVSRSIGPFLLLMSIFGTTMTGFAMVGSTGKAYTSGIGVYGLMASWSGLIHSAVFFVVGIRLWAVGKRHGYVTQCEYFRARFESPALAGLLFPVLVLLVIPYLLVGVISAGKFLQGATAGMFPDLFSVLNADGTPHRLSGAIPPWLGSGGICLIVLVYVFAGGLRGAVWANTFQTIVFMIAGALAFYMITSRLGGLAEAGKLVLESEYGAPRAAREGLIGKAQFFSYFLIPLSVGMFPHLFQHWLTAKSAKSFRLTVVAHPIFIMIVWLPCILIGLWAAAKLGAGKSPNAVLGMMVSQLVHSPILSGIVGAGVLAAIMSSLDSQFMCLGTMFTNDVVIRFFHRDRLTDRQKILLARGFILGIVTITYLLALFLKDSAHVFDLGVWCFSGFAALFPLVFAAVYWRRATRAGAIASLITTLVVWSLLFYQDIIAGSQAAGPKEEFLLAGMMPVVFIFAASALAMVVVSLLTPAPRRETLSQFFDEAATPTPDAGPMTPLRPVEPKAVLDDYDMSSPSVETKTIDEAQAVLDAHVRETVKWHFSPETGCPFWLEWAAKAGWDPREVIGGFGDLLTKFPHFQDEWLRDEQPDVWVPAAFKGKPFNVFETGGTTGMPKQRIGWTDYQVDYEEFSGKIADEHFPPGGAWLMVGPTGPRRLRLAIEHLANFRGSPCYFVDLDPRWVKKVLAEKQFEVARAYMDHVVDQALTLLRHRRITGLFTTPKLLESLSEKLDLYDAGIRGVFCGGTTMEPQYVRYLVEEVLEGRIGFYPTYGNTLMGLAASVPLTSEDKFSVTYYAPQPRAVLRVVDPKQTDRLVEYDHWGRVELTTMTKEFFMPRFLERDEAIRRSPRAPYAWDGVAEVRPFGAMEKQIVEGVY